MLRPRLLLSSVLLTSALLTAPVRSGAQAGVQAGAQSGIQAGQGASLAERPAAPAYPAPPIAADATPAGERTRLPTAPTDRPAPPAGEAPARPTAAPRPAPAAKAPKPPEVREILLTFDDGPRPELTSQVLAQLEAHNIKAVFFVLGQRFQGKSAEAEHARELMREMIRRGHVVGNHTIHHYFLCGKRGPKIAAQEIEQNAEMIEQVIGMRPPLFRTPYGAHCKTLAATLQQLNVRHTGWDIDPQDWRLRDPQKILAFMQNALRKHKGRAVVLFHDVQPATIAMLPQLLQWIDQDNAARQKAGQPELKYLEPSYLLTRQGATPPGAAPGAGSPNAALVPPVLDGIARVLLDTIRLWPAPLAFLPPIPALAAPAAPPPPL